MARRSAESKAVAKRQRVTANAQTKTPTRTQSSARNTATRYVLEIYLDDASPRLIDSFQSSEPFLPIQRGQRLAIAAPNANAAAADPLIVTRVEHEIGRLPQLIHKLRVFADTSGAVGPDVEHDTAAGWTTSFDTIDDWVSGKVDEYWPRIIAVWDTKIAPTMRGRLADDEAMADAFQRLYQLVPGFIRFLVREEQFVAFLLRNRDRFITAEAAPAGAVGSTIQK